MEIIDLNDNRCPVGAVCNEPGTVIVNMRILCNEEIEIATLYYSEIPYAKQNIDTILGYRIELLEVNPIPNMNQPVESDSIYSVIVLAEKL
jgi:hypothetical protein